MQTIRGHYTSLWNLSLMTDIDPQSYEFLCQHSIPVCVLQVYVLSATCNNYNHVVLFYTFSNICVVNEAKLKVGVYSIERTIKIVNKSQHLLCPFSLKFHIVHPFVLVVLSS